MIITIDRHTGAMMIRRWLYLVSIVSYLIMLIPISLVAYTTFYHTLIPNPMVQIPLTFDDVSSETMGQDMIRLGEMVSHIDVAPYKSLFNQPILQYDVRLNIEILCNRNRNDDVYPIVTELNTGLNKVRNQFILNCDARYLYHQNNWFIPYNVRFWSPPVITNINKNTNIDRYLTTISGRDVQQWIKLKQIIDLKVFKNIIINHERTFLEFHVQYQGFRYYVIKYYFTSLLIGVSIFWSIATTISLLVALILFYTNYSLIHNNSNLGKQKHPEVKIKQE